MKRKSIGMILLVVAMFFGTGCTSDVKNIDKLDYVSAIGVDYKDGKYYAYIQLIDFFSLAKTSEGQKMPAKVWVGEGVGDSLEEALFDLYRTSQERIYWGHMTSILISESAFKKGFETIYDSFVRYYEFRQTTWVYSTRESIKDIFTTVGFFGQSPLSTILHEPLGVFDQTSLIKSIKLHRLIRQINEPGFTSYIPTLVINNKQWVENKKSDPKLMIDGAIFLKNDEFRSYIPLKKLNGLRWVMPGTIRAGIPVPDKVKPAVQIVIDRPKTKLKLVNQGAQPQFNIEMKATGNIVNRSNDKLLGLPQLTDETAAAIEKEIREVYQLGLKEKTDILNLEYQLYRYHYDKWKELSSVEDTLLTENAINTIKIDINITQSNIEKDKRMERSK